MLSPTLPSGPEGRWHTLPEDFTDICWQQKCTEKRTICSRLQRECDVLALLISDKLGPTCFILSGLPLSVSCLFLCYDSLLCPTSSPLNCPCSSHHFFSLLAQFPCGTQFSLTSLGFSLLFSSLGWAVSTPKSHFSWFDYFLSLCLFNHFPLQLVLYIPRLCSCTTAQSCANFAWHWTQAWVESLMIVATLIQMYKQSRIFKVL